MNKRKYDTLKMQNGQIDHFGYSSVNTLILTRILSQYIKFNNNVKKAISKNVIQDAKFLPSFLINFKRTLLRGYVFFG